MNKWRESQAQQDWNGEHPIDYPSRSPMIHQSNLFSSVGTTKPCLLSSLSSLLETSSSSLMVVQITKRSKAHWMEGSRIRGTRVVMHTCLPLSSITITRLEYIAMSKLFSRLVISYLQLLVSTSATADRTLVLDPEIRRS